MDNYIPVKLFDFNNISSVWLDTFKGVYILYLWVPFLGQKSRGKMLHIRWSVRQSEKWFAMRIKIQFLSTKQLRLDASSILENRYSDQ